MRRSFILGIAVVAALGLACSSDNNNPPPDSGTPAADSGVPDSGTPDSGTPDAGTTVTVTISGFSYSPVSINVSHGDTVHFVNNDSMAHTATTEAADDSFTPGAVGNVQFDTGNIQGGGGSVDIPIPSNAQSGATVPYYCAIHTSGMTTPNGHIVIQ